jgi:hypothetical protein
MKPTFSFPVGAAPRRTAGKPSVPAATAAAEVDLRNSRRVLRRSGMFMVEVVERRSKVTGGAAKGNPADSFDPPKKIQPPAAEWLRRADVPPRTILKN